MKRRALFAAGLLAIGLASGVARWPIWSEPGEASRIEATARSTPESGIDSPAGALNEGWQTARVASSGRRRFSPIPVPEWPLTPEGAPDGASVDVGEPLDADRSEGWESVSSAGDSVEIGPMLDADDPFWLELSVSSEAPSDIGETLDADDHAASPAEGEDFVSIGPELNADDP